MKVICAGYSKTGTKSMTAALTILGYNVYDSFEQFGYQGDDWMKIITSGGTVEDLKRMFKDVDAGSDGAVLHYWEELHQAFPEAKVILTVRDEDSWYKSISNHFSPKKPSIIFHMILTLSPTGRRFFKFLQTICIRLMGACWPAPYRTIQLNEMMMRMRYRRHNEYVMQHAPKDKLLVFSVKDGWGPLCEFLGKEIPDRLFPRKNVGATLIQDALKENPAMKKMMRELMMMLGLLSGISVFGSYLVFKRFPWSTWRNIFSDAFSRFFV